jgi:hypothetical protein
MPCFAAFPHLNVAFLMGQSRGWLSSAPACGYPAFGCLGRGVAKKLRSFLTMHLLTGSVPQPHLNRWEGTWLCYGSEMRAGSHDGRRRANQWIRSKIQPCKSSLIQSNIPNHTSSTLAGGGKAENTSCHQSALWYLRSSYGSSTSTRLALG